MTEAAATPLGYPPLPADPAAPPPPVSRWAEGALGLATLVGVGLLGFPMGWLWQLIAPHTPAVRRPDGAYLTAPEAEHRIADEGWYLILTVGLGLVLAVAVWVVLRRYRGPVLMAALTLGALACAIVTWKFGHHFGYAHARTLIDAPTWTGTTDFTLPVDLRAAKTGLWHGWLPYAKGDVLAMPITVLLVYLLLAGFSPYPALRPTHRFNLAPAASGAPVGPTDTANAWSPAGYGELFPPDYAPSVPGNGQTPTYGPPAAPTGVPDGADARPNQPGTAAG